MPLLIYAFKDGNGCWHGDPDIPLIDLDDEPGRGMLTYQPVPGTPETASPFAGQTLTALYGSVDLDAGPVTYQLDTGGRFPSSWHVHTLLAAPRGAAPLSESILDGPDRLARLETAFTESSSLYALTGTRASNGQLTVELTVSTDQGEIQSELCGAVSDEDLQPLARLLEAASRTLTGSCTPAVPSPPTAGPWTPQERAHLAARFRQERDFAALAAEFRRSRGAIYAELKRQQLISDPRQERTTPKSEKAPTPSPILQQRRLIDRNSHARWSDEDDQRLSRRCAEGATNAELCEEFGRSRGAIESRLLKVGATGPAADEARLNHL
ncbi:hypothetical protein YWIDRAFT_07971 [Streptomyces sp. SceaMP-e96]|uniref:hypothetical protein n=1 Tax=unclassified Streptomyces TaxID=2593676 RepID=UPI000823CE2A|nr:MULTISPECIES: hypothetical protein [unclassified Streptomyces]MYT18280.1 hypothetical protein [Streptomyces sp. SID4951]SCK54217.1 hypothetical protein YWIDRAFT_07971 [Streptomyces sp. SceaMP-e96]